MLGSRFIYKKNVLVLLSINFNYMTDSNIFKGQFEAELFEEISQCPIIELPVGSVLRQPENMRVRYTPLVLEGSIKVTRIDDSGKEIIMYYINAGESCFLTITASLANNFGNIDSLRAVTELPTKMFSVTDEQIRAWNDKYRSWRNFISQMYNDRFTQFFSLVDAIAFKSVDDRLIDKLKQLSEQKNPIEITHAELANHLGTAREVVSRLLKRLELDGKLKLGNKLIEVLKF
jgi:CRP/FNR family transcriptional regulator, anaerobic regulatory protein